MKGETWKSPINPEPSIFDSQPCSTFDLLHPDLSVKGSLSMVNKKGGDRKMTNQRPRKKMMRTSSFSKKIWVLDLEHPPPSTCSPSSCWIFVVLGGSLLH